MCKVYILLFALFITGCFKQVEPVKQFPNKVINVDSVQNIIHNLVVENINNIHTADSLKSVIRQQKILIKFTALKCHKYATIVKKNPSQSVFIVNWIDRSFLWINNK